ncbi:beta and beta-prime subunits of DNA dependent RNA-polymerase [Mycena olivaceomarginata]|nr:beta and beta-prime subunits of DNA dependent RNA-polymerase [Mycena olivaceomarginata]
MLGQQFVYSGAPIRKVTEVQFGIFSPEEIKRSSVAEIEHLDLYDQATRNPKVGGLMDRRMGPNDPNSNCLTCGEGLLECPGHFAHIELARPVFHPGFIFKVKKILECICTNCGKLKADISDPEFTDKIRHIRDPKNRMAVVWAHCRTMPEGHAGCGYAQRHIRKEGLRLLQVAEYAKPKLDVDDDEMVEPTQPEPRLLSPSDISDPDLDLLGLSHKYARPEWMILTVLPVPPPCVRPSIVIDRGTRRKEDDLTFKLGNIISASVEVRRCEQEGKPAHELLQFHVATYMGDDIAGIRVRCKTLAAPEEGRLRGNLISKRVDFSARTVITGDPNIELDEVVTPYNIGYLQELVSNGPTVYPGARYVVCDTGERIDLRYNQPANGALTIWMDSITPSVPQSEEARAELSEIAWIISPTANKPILGFVQDSLCGIRKFTLRDTFLDWNQVQDILLWVTEWDGVVPMPAIVKPKPLWTGKQIIGLVIPRGINVARSSNDKMDRSNPILFGVVDKMTVGITYGGLIHVVFREKGAEVTMRFISGVQKVVNFWLFHNGFSLGIGDFIVDRATMSSITHKIAEGKSDVARLIHDANHDRFSAAPGMTIRETFERSVQSVLDYARDCSGSYAQRSLKDNNVIQMLVAGSAGLYINISQMTACVGRQSVDGGRIPFGFQHRTLPHFTQDDFNPEARGFVGNSYLRGLTPQEFFFHAMAGREDLINAELIKALQDVMVCYDGTVRNSRGDIIQFRQTVNTFALNDEEFKNNYHLDVMDEKSGSGGGVLQSCQDSELLQLQTKLAEDRKLLRTFIFQRDISSLFRYLPVNLPRVVQNAAQIFHIDCRQTSHLDPIYIIDAVKALGERLIIIRGDDSLSKQAQEDAVLVFRMHLRATFAARQVVEKYRLSREAFDWALGEVESKFNQAVVNPGNMNVLRGVPRLQEIINVAANIETPSLTVYLNPDISDDPRRSQLVARELEDIPLRAVTSAVEIWYDPDPTSTFIEDDVDFVQDFFAIPDEEVESKLQPPISLNRTKMGGKLSMHYVASHIAQSFGGDLFVIWNEDNSEKLIIRCRGLNKEEDGMCSIPGDIFLRRLENTMLDFISLGGVKGIRRVSILRYNKAGFEADGSIQMECVLETEGINLKAAIGIDGVDYKRTYSNSCVEIFNVLGIEAARAAILKELRDVFEWGGSYINYRHLALLCDLMTHWGTLTALTRRGINCSNTGALKRCSEKTLLEAAAVGEKDDCCGVVENLMFGHMPPMGTGALHENP